MTGQGNDGCCEPGCCEGDGKAVAEDVRASVREGYAEIARSGQWSGVAPSDGGCCGGGGCCGPTTLSADQVAQAVGYSADELSGLPSGANMGLSCGNPTAVASLREGEVVVDLGSGGGFDCFIAGRRVGASGRVIGVDMTAEMVSKARGNLGSYRDASGLDNVEFRLGEIEHLPVADGSADVVISNCVLNLSTDKGQVWHEIARVLKPGGRVAVSDLGLLKPLPAEVAGDVEALVGCVAGAELVEATRGRAEAAGLVDIEVVSKPEYVEAMTNGDDPLYQKIAAALPAGERIADYVTSVDIRARRSGV